MSKARPDRRLLVPALTAVLFVAVLAGTAVAVPISVGVDAPDTVSPGESVTMTYEITNEGEESTAALGIEMHSVPTDATVESIETDTGTVAENQHAVFWIDPVDPGETVTVTYTLTFDASAAAGPQTVEAQISSDTTSIDEDVVITVEDTTDDGTNDDADGEETGDESTDSDDATDEDGTDDDEDDATVPAGGGTDDGLFGYPIEVVAVAGLVGAAVLYLVVRNRQ